MQHKIKVGDYISYINKNRIFKVLAINEDGYLDLKEVNSVYPDFLNLVWKCSYVDALHWALHTGELPKQVDHFQLLKKRVEERHLKKVANHE